MRHKDLIQTFQNTKGGLTCLDENCGVCKDLFLKRRTFSGHTEVEQRNAFEKE